MSVSRLSTNVTCLLQLVGPIKLGARKAECGEASYACRRTRAVSGAEKPTGRMCSNVGVDVGGKYVDAGKIGKSEKLRN